MRSRLACALLCALFLSACDMPRDPENTLNDVTGGKMRVGVTHHEPWVVLGEGEPAGVEVELVKLFAEELDAEIEWVEGSESEIAGAMEVRALDLAIGGFTATNPASAEMSLSHPYLTTQTVVGVPASSDVEEDITGVPVSVERGSQAAGLLEKTDADVVLVEDITEAEGARALDNFLIDDLELEDTGVRLEESDHVMAVPHGENAWLVRLERFLLTRVDEINEILEREDM